jgi:transposase
VKSGVERLNVTTEELEPLLEGVREPLGEAAYQKLKAALRTLAYVTELLENREATLATLRRLLCRASTEKTAQVLKQAGVEGGEKKRKPAGARTPETPAPGHGRREAGAHRGAPKIQVPHESLHQGDRCPECRRGKVYPLRNPGLLVRIQGQAPIAATCMS